MMLRRYFLFVIVFLIGCKPSHELAKSGQLIFSIQKGPCFGTCPEYKLEVFANGEARLKGIRNVELIGDYKTQLSPSLITEVTNAVNAMNVASLDSNYVNKYLTDFPAIDLEFDVEGGRKQIHVFHEDPPVEIKKVLEMINGIESKIQWNSPTKTDQ